MRLFLGVFLWLYFGIFLEFKNYLRYFIKISTTHHHPLGPRASNFIHFAHCVILFAHDITLFVQRVTLEQIFVGPTHVVKNEVQEVI